MHYTCLNEEDYEKMMSSLTHYLIHNNGIMLTDKNGIVVYMNEAMTHIMHVDPDKLVGHPVSDLETKSMVSHSATCLTLRAGKPRGTLSQNPDGSIGFAIGSFIYNEKGELEYVISQGSSTNHLMAILKAIMASPFKNAELQNVVNAFQEKNNPLYFKSEVFFNIIKRAERIASFDTDVLITGESGVGKDALASYIQKHSVRANMPFVPVLIPAIPENLLESELFGYEPNSFTGSSSEGKPGLFESANHGTILLDEIGDIPFPLQVKLLRFIETKEYIKVGGVKPVKLDVRIIATTNKNLEEMSKKGLFRDDLFYRINTLSINVPPLRERPEDIQPIADHYLRNLNEKYMTNKQISPSGIDLISRAYWRGNIRELRNTIEKIYIELDSDIWTAQNLAPFIGLMNAYAYEDTSSDSEVAKDPESYIRDMPKRKLSIKDVLNNLDRQEEYLIADALRKAKGNKSKAAEILGCSRATFYRKMKRINDLYNRGQ